MLEGGLPPTGGFMQGPLDSTDSGLADTVPYVIGNSHSLSEQNGVLGQLEWDRNKQLAELIRTRGEVAERGIQTMAEHFPEAVDVMRAMHKVHLNLITISAAAGISIGEGPLTPASRMLRDYIGQMDGAPRTAIHPEALQDLVSAYGPSMGRLYAQMEELLGHRSARSSVEDFPVSKLEEPGIVVPLSPIDRRAQLNTSRMRGELDPGISRLLLERHIHFQPEIDFIYEEMGNGTTERAVTGVPIAYMDFQRVSPRLKYRLPGDGFFEYTTRGGELRLCGLRLYDPRSLIGLYHFESGAGNGPTIQHLEGQIYRTIAGMDQSQKDQILV